MQNNTHRLAQLQLFFDEDPLDPFNAYALALEYQKTDETKAAHFFEVLLRDFPDYVPTYYPAAQFFAQGGQEEKARTTFAQGMAAAARAQNEKARRELRGALEHWEEEWG